LHIELLKLSECLSPSNAGYHLKKIFSIHNKFLIVLRQ